MEYVRLGRSNVKVSRLCLGAMGFGSTTWREWVLDEAASEPIIDRAIEHGINFFDTCDFYSAGESERILGKLLVGKHPRDSFVLATKAGNPMASHPNGRGYSRKHLFNAIDQSLARLRTDHVDLFQTHIWNADTDLEELVDTMGAIVEAGKARYVGVTTMPAWTLAVCRTHAERRQSAKFVSMQCEYNPAHRECERELMPYCLYDNVALIPFSPMARGFLSANRQGGRNPTSRTNTDDYTHKYYYRDGDFAVQAVLSGIAERHGCSPSQVALAWTLSRPGMTAPIFGATSIQHVDEAVGSLDLSLSEGELSEINAAYVPRGFNSAGH
ncbi:Predicted oxidoreductase [Roseovarius azorensis]|uniref:Predicted oxidoreductase n=1 Tax=Roseovarius azorensis TaxID=1287727 RepID=A0A1H7Y264_9RHOB|nr:aldo/keto reductase [Roseovarius azorensis]SEM39269.1 Predicted oxidoreductase [Roseovarius azorensis]